MTREKDARDHSLRQANTINAITGTPVSTTASTAGATAAPDPASTAASTTASDPTSNAIPTAAPNASPKAVADQAYTEAAVEYVRSRASETMGLDGGPIAEFVPDPYIQRTSANRTVVSLHQQYQGVSLFGITTQVHFGPDRRPRCLVGDPASTARMPPTVPVVDAAQAVLIAARYLERHADSDEDDGWGQVRDWPVLEVASDYQPRVISAFERPNRPTVLDRGPFGKEVPAILVFFYLDSEVRLCWQLRVTMPDGMQEYLMLVAADRSSADHGDPPDPDDAVLLCTSTTSGATAAATANVFLHNPGFAGREVVELPRPADTYPLNGTAIALPNPFPPQWWIDADSTIGNCVNAVDADNATAFVGTTASGALSFDPAQEDSAEQRLLNAFFFCNYMHDFFYMLGFDENAGNFQRMNLTCTGAATDAVLVQIHPREILFTANMKSSGTDGKAPTLNLGTVSLADGIRHTALDADVVFHEYVHGVSNRLVGGRMHPVPLQQPQSKGMGEGWGDYFALTIQNHSRPVEKVILADWATGKPGGLRSAPYDDDYPNRFGTIGAPAFTSPHRIGEIWCATLMHMHRALDRALGAPRGHQLAWQIVFDGMKVTPANPSFLDGREAILAALEDLHEDGRLSSEEAAVARRTVWTSFARFGMGAAAASAGASLKDIVEDTSLPADVEIGA